MPIRFNLATQHLKDIQEIFEMLIPFYLKYNLFQSMMRWNYIPFISYHFHDGKMDNVLNIPKDELPLHINDKDNYDRMLVEWRLSCNF